MNIIVICALAVAVTVIITLMKELKPEFCVIISVAFGAIVLSVLAGPIKKVVDLLFSVAEMTGISNDLLEPMIKIAGISLIAEFASSICMDAGHAAIAGRVETTAKITILALSAPIILDILNKLTSVIR